MAKVGIVMGSDSDMPVMSKRQTCWKNSGIEYEMTTSLHTGNRMYSLICQSPEEKG